MSTAVPRPWAAPLGLGIFLALIYLVSMATSGITNDAQTSSLMSWRIVQTGAPWFDGFDYSPWDDEDFQLWIGQAANGHLVGFRSPGPVMAGLPVYGALSLVGVDSYSLVPGSVVAALMTTVALVLLFLAIRPRAGGGVAVGAVLALGLTTPVWSVSADSLWTHPVTLLGIGGMAWAASRDRWLLVGLFGGIALWGRLHMTLIVAILGLAIAIVRRRPRIALQVGLVSAAGLALATLWGRWMYGTWSPAGGYSVSGYTERAVGGGDNDRDVLGLAVNHLGMWVSPDRGVLVWTPALLVLFPAVVRAWRGLPDWSRWLGVGGVAYTLVQGQLNGFSGGSAFYGYRLTLELLVCVFPAYALAFHRAGRWALRSIGPVLGLQFAALSIGAVTGGMLNEEHLWTDNSFLFALREVPALVVWPLLMMLFGWLAGQVLLRRAALRAREASSDEGSDVGAGDELDRV